MGGSLPFKDALFARLKLIQPSEQDLQQCLAKYPPRLTPGIDKVIARLQGRGVHVYLITGGFRQVRKTAAALLLLCMSKTPS